MVLSYLDSFSGPLCPLKKALLELLVFSATGIIYALLEFQILNISCSSFLMEICKSLPLSITNNVGEQFGGEESFLMQILTEPSNTEFSSLKISLLLTCPGHQRAMSLICFMEMEETAAAIPITLETTIQLSFPSKGGC